MRNALWLREVLIRCIGGARSMRNSAIACACLLAVFEGVGIAMQRAFAQPPIVFTPLL